MLKKYINQYLVKKVFIFLMLFISYSSVSADDNDGLLNLSIEQSILSRYQQVLIESYDYYSEKLGFRETKASLKIKHFPVLIENKNKGISQQSFYTERFFSNLYAIKNPIEIKPEVIKTKVKQKIIRISNIPVTKGYLSSKFGLRKDPFHGLRRMHKGIDIAAKYGSTVHPLGEGTVIFAGYKSGYGNTVEIKHGNTVLTRYAHLKEFLVDAGQLVNIKDNIGLIGNSGRSTGPHLHLEVLFNGSQVDPQIFLANHFGSRTNTYQVAQVKPSRKTVRKKRVNKVISKKYPQVKDFPQVSYQDYVKSVNGMFGFSAPALFSK